MQRINDGTKYVPPIIKESQSIKGIDSQKTKRPTTESIVIKTSDVDVTSEDYTLVLGAVKNHATIIFKTNAIERSQATTSNELQTLLINRKKLPEIKEDIKALKASPQTKTIIAETKKNEALLSDLKKSCTKEKQNILEKKIEKYERNVSRYYDWQVNTLDIYGDEIFSNEKMLANYVFALRNFHDEITIFTLYDNNSGKQALFALCRVPVSTMKQFHNDQAWDTPAYIAYPMNEEYKKLDITVQDMMTYRKTKDQVINILTKNAPHIILLGQKISTDENNPKVFAINMHTAKDKQINPKVTAGVTEHVVANS